jgi:hypothetical protein
MRTGGSAIFRKEQFMFTDGKMRQYESMMQKTPGYRQRHSGKRTQGFIYKYTDLDCGYCLYHRKCGFEVCPYIMEYHDDLRHDPEFHVAVENAQICESAHRNTLVVLQMQFYGDSLNGR